LLLASSPENIPSCFSQFPPILLLRQQISQISTVNSKPLGMGRPLSRPKYPDPLGRSLVSRVVDLNRICTGGSVPLIPQCRRLDQSRRTPRWPVPLRRWQGANSLRQSSALKGNQSVDKCKQNSVDSNGWAWRCRCGSVPTLNELADV
jgi:hypothetical protein